LGETLKVDEQGNTKEKGFVGRRKLSDSERMRNRLMGDFRTDVIGGIYRRGQEEYLMRGGFDRRAGGKGKVGSVGGTPGEGLVARNTHS